MNHQEIRRKFLDFFEKRGHKIMPSSSLIPEDSSVLFTTAGMQQFKNYYTSPEIAPSKNIVSIQKCLRTSDIDEVGDESHLTFFEMLGNFSFGGYWKKEAIEMAHEFITKEMGLKIDYVSVFKGKGDIPADDESEKIWKSIDPNLKIIYRVEENIWGPTGDEGPFGPTVEIYVNGIEVWNIVFNEYYRDRAEESKLGERILPPGLRDFDIKGIDTGMGLERLVMVSQGKSNIFETDLFAPILNSIIEIQGDKPIEQIRIILDHLRAAIFLIGDGVLPGKDKRNYIPRRLIRRALTAHYLYIGAGLDKFFFHKPVDKIIDVYKNSYPYLKEKRNEIMSTIQEEVDKSSKVLIGTVKDLKKIYNSFISGIDPEKQLPNIIIQGNVIDIDGRILFKIRETHGVHFEIMRMVMEKWGFKFSQKTQEQYDEAYREHQRVSSVGAEKKFGGHGLLLDTGELKAGNEEELKKATRLHTATHLLHAALRKVLGDEVKQAGSDITAERLRFDFSFSRKMTPEEIKQVEDMINKIIEESVSVEKEEMSYEEAIKSGASAFFKEKYPDRVNIYSIGSFSKELCGGPHVLNTSEIGKFKIVKEESISAGTRRIRAIVQ